MTAFRYLFAVALFGLSACVGDARAASSTPRSTVLSMPGSRPFGQRDDGLCYDVDNKGPGFCINGEADRMFNTSLYVGIEEDFLGSTKVGDVDDTTLSSGPWMSQDAATAGCPAAKADYDNGAIELLLDNGNEVGDCTIYFGDELSIDSDTEPFCIFRITFQTQPTANATLSWGLASARNALQESIANFAVFSVTGADSNLDVQSDDASVDVADTDTTVDMTAGTFIETMVSLNSMHGRTVNDTDGASATDVHFFYRTTTGGAWTQILPTSTFSVGADTALQPYIQVEKASSTETPDLLVDRVACYWQRE